MHSRVALLMGGDPSHVIKSRFNNCSRTIIIIVISYYCFCYHYYYYYYYITVTITIIITIITMITILTINIQVAEFGPGFHRGRRGGSDVHLLDLMIIVIMI